MKFGSWFSGYGGVDCGALEAGFDLEFAFEYDPDIAAVYASNLGNHVTIGDILLSDSGIYHPDYPRTKNEEKRRRQDITGEWWARVGGCDFQFSKPQFPFVNVKNDSPPCPRFSLANANRGETLRDIALARKCCEYLMYAKPDFYSLENVYLYRKSESFKIILNTLKALGYSYDWWHINMADYGVPQVRKRLILFARKDGKPVKKPMQTHYNPNGKKAESGFVGSLFWKPWNGWYQAIEDLIPDLPDSQFADWQLARLPKEIKDSLLFANGSFEGKIPVASKDNPAGTVTANENQASLRTFIVGDQTSNGGQSAMIRNNTNPSFTVDTRPASKIKAFITDRLNSSNENPNRFAHEPAKTVTVYNSKHQPPNGWVNGRVVQINTRCLARFQGFPDWYTLSGNNKVDCRGLGNAGPPPFFTILYRECAERSK